MAASHGQLHPFDSSVEDWSTFIERAELYFDANDITVDAKKRGVLLSSCGPKTFTMIKSIVAPAKPADVPYKDLEEIIGGHYNPKPMQSVQRCLFNSRSRKPGESMATFVNELKKLAEHCGFESADKLNENLRDRLICGINDERWQKRLLAKDKPDYKKVYDLALTLEAAEKGVKELRETSSQGNSHKVHKIDRGGSKEKSEGGAGACCRCGGKNHSQAYCYHRHAVCHNCGKKGHIGRVCRSKGKPQQHRDNPEPQQRGKKSQQIGIIA